MLKRIVDVYETPKGWMLIGPTTLNGPTEAIRRKTAVDALRFIKKCARDSNTSNVTVINWHPATSVGSIVVKALQN